MKRDRHPEAYDYYVNERGFTVEEVEELHEDLIIGGWEMAQENYLIEATDEEIEAMFIHKASEVPKALCSGVFWVITESYDMSDYKLLVFEIPCDRNGTILGTHRIPLNAKSECTYNHKKLWEFEIKNNAVHKPYNRKTFDYYPRGRIEVSNNCATIYLNPHINQPKVLEDIKTAFGLKADNIEKIKVIADNSAHYACFIG